MDKATSDLIIGIFTGVVGPGVTATAVIAWKLRNINKTMEKITENVLTNTADRLQKDQVSKFESLEERLEAATRERDSLQQQVRTLMMIITEIKERHAAEKAEFEKKIAELNARIDQLNAERKLLLIQLGRSDDEEKGSTRTEGNVPAA